MLRMPMLPGAAPLALFQWYVTSCLIWADVLRSKTVPPLAPFRTPALLLLLKRSVCAPTTGFGVGAGAHGPACAPASAACRDAAAPAAGPADDTAGAPALP